VFAGKKSAQIREILISESAWEEMTCLFAPSLVASVYLIAAIPSALFVGKPKPSAISIIIIFIFLDIKSSPWRNFFLVCWCVELLMAYILHIFIFCYSGSTKKITHIT
jgi:hypothetical protein